MAWTRAEVDKLVTMYPDPGVTREQLEAAFPRRRWGAIRKQAHKVSVRRPTAVVDGAVHQLVKSFRSILAGQGVSPAAVLEETGRGRHLAREWLRGRTNPRLSHFDDALREAGFRLAILPIDLVESAAHRSDVRLSYSGVASET